MEEQAEVTEELIAALTENHTRQMVTLIKSTTETMKEMMTLIKNQAANAHNPTKANSDKEKKKKRKEKRKRYKETSICAHCGKKHPSKKEDKFWELEKNKASRPANWKLSKSTWRCAGSTIAAETWQPGKVNLNKLTTINTYPAVTNYWAPLNNKEKEEETKKEEIVMLQQSTKPPDQRANTNKWTRRIGQQWEQQIKRKEEEIIIDSGATSHFVSKTLDLPQTGPSQITVYLPDNSTLKTTSKTQLPFEQLSAEAREAHILTGLAKSLLSVNKMEQNCGQ